MMNEADLVQRVHELYAAFGRGDVAAITERVRPDVEWRYEVDYALPGVAPTMGPFRGRDGVRAYFERVGAHLAVKKLAPVAFLTSPGRVAALIEKDIAFVRTGRGYDGLLVHLFEFDEAGLIARHVHFDDTAKIIAAWGNDAKIQIVQRVYEAFGQGDVTTILSLVHDDVDWASCPGSTVAPWHGVMRGKREVARFFAALADVQVTRFEPLTFAANGADVLCVIRFGMRVPSTGKSGEMDIHHLWSFKDGKIARYRGTEDTALTAALFAK